MQHLLLTTIAAVVLVGCGESQQSAPTPESKPAEPVAEAAKPEPPTAKAPDISIHDAVEKGNIEAVKQHIAAGTDVNAMGGMSGGTPLTFAAIEGHKEIVELLIAKGADVEVADLLSATPLHRAASWGHKEIAELLITKGANVNAEDKWGNTPLHLAAYKGHKENVKLLIAKGADVNAKNEDGETPLDDAVRYKQTEIAALLRKHGGKTSEELRAEGN